MGVRTSTTNTWGFLPPRHDTKNTQPPSGLDQFAMEEFARQLYNVKTPRKGGGGGGNQSRNGGKTTRSDLHEEDEDGYSGDEADGDTNGGYKSPSKNAKRNSLLLDLKQAQDNTMNRLSKPHSLHNTPVSSPHAVRSKSMTDRGPRGTRNSKDRALSLPPIPRKGQNGNSKMAWENTNKPGKPVKIYQDKHNKTGLNTSNEATTNHHQQNGTVHNAPSPTKTPKSKPNEQEPTKSLSNDNKNSQNIPPPKIVVQPPPPQNKPTIEPQQSKQPRALTPIKENPAKETPANKPVAPQNKLKAAKPPAGPKPKAKPKPAAKAQPEDSSDPTKIDLEKYNPDGSLRTMHVLPDFQESLHEALKARYLRSRYKQWYEREMSVSECWSEQNLPSKSQAI